MSRDSKQKAERKPLVGRLAGYGARRIAHGGEHTRRRLHIMSLKSALQGAMTVQRIDVTGARQGWNGRYEDGGRAAFAELVKREGLSEQGLQQIARWHSWAAMGYLAAALAVLVLAVIQFTSYDLSLGLMAVAMFVVSLPLAALALRHAFAGWQIRERRFGGLGEYLRGRR